MTAQNARKQPRARAVPDDDGDLADGVIRIGDEPEEPRYEELFRLRGQPYEVLANPPASMMLKYFDQVRKRGANAAFSWALEQMVGADAYKALLEDDAVTRADFQQVIDLILGILLGNPETLPKSRATGSRRSGG